jgi:hypothetical protein
MPIGPAELDAIAAAFDAGTEPRVTAAALRGSLPGFTVTLCDARDLDGEAPFRVGACASLYLVDNADHCWRLTGDAARATGVVVAAHRAAVP